MSSRIEWKKSNLNKTPNHIRRHFIIRGETGEGVAVPRGGIVVVGYGLRDEGKIPFARTVVYALSHLEWSRLLMNQFNFHN